MRKFIQFYLIPLCSLIFLFYGCGSDDVNVFDPNPASGLRPTITNIVPDSLAASGIVTITGTNFNADPDKNIVVFGSKAVVPSSATQTTLEMTVPFGLAGTDPEDLMVKVVVQNSEFLSNEFSTTALPNIKVIEGFSNSRGVAVDAVGNVYVSDGDDWTVYKIPIGGGDWENYTDTGGNGDIVFDAAGNLYVCIGGDWGSEIYKVPPGGGDSELFSGNEDLSPFDLDFDADGNMYVGGRRSGLHKVSPTGDVEYLDVDVEDPLSVRVFNGYLYWCNNDNNTIERAQINAGGLGEVEIMFEDGAGKYFDSPLGIEMDAKGNVYVVSKDWGGNQNLSRINADGTAEIIVELPSSNNRHIAIGNKSIYVATQWEGVVYEVFVGEDPAPVY